MPRRDIRAYIYIYTHIRENTASLKIINLPSSRDINSRRDSRREKQIDKSRGGGGRELHTRHAAFTYSGKRRIFVTAVRVRASVGPLKAASVFAAALSRASTRRYLASFYRLSIVSLSSFYRNNEEWVRALVASSVELIFFSPRSRTNPDGLFCISVKSRGLCSVYKTRKTAKRMRKTIR